MSRAEALEQGQSLHLKDYNAIGRKTKAAACAAFVFNMVNNRRNDFHFA
jgi:hypothetical protein